MRCEVGLIIEWSKCDTGDIAIESVDDVMEYVQAAIESNAQFEHLDLSVENIGARELDNDEDYEEEKPDGV